MILAETTASRGEYFVLTATYESSSGRCYPIHYTLPEWVRDPVSDDHFFVLGATMAFILGEDYSQDLPVTHTTLQNFRQAMATWVEWYPYRKSIDVSVPICEDRVAPEHEALSEACFFTAGIDSLFTAHKLDSQITALVTVLHVEANPDVIQDAIDDVKAYFDFADATGRTFIPVATNLMTAVPEMMDAWSYLTHGAAYSSVGHALSGEIRRIHISSSAPYFGLMPWGSHPDTDKRFSSASLEVNHFGAEWERWDKTVALVGDPVSLSVMNVCAAGKMPGKYSNCSKCQKCARTMMMMDLAGVDKQQAGTFDWSLYDLNRIADLHLRSKNEFNSMHDVRNKAIELGRGDIVTAISHMLARSEKFLFLTEWEFVLRQRVRQVVWLKRPLKAFRGGVYRLLGLRRSV